MKINGCLKILITALILINVTNIFSQDLLKHRWENRILLVKTNNIQNGLFEQQISELAANEEDLLERKLIVYQLQKDKYKIGFNTGVWKNIDNKNLLNLIQSAESNFEVMLIGLDGGIKLRQSSILSSKDLFAIIDGMPMRMQELESKKSKKYRQLNNYREKPVGKNGRHF